MSFECRYLSHDFFNSTAEYMKRRALMGKKKYAEMLALEPTSTIPSSFHLGSQLALDTSPGEYHPEEIIYRLAGVTYPDFKSSRYGLLYAQSMSLMKIVKAQQSGDSAWPVNLYSTDFNRWGVIETVCTDLALEGVTDLGNAINPPLSLRLIDSVQKMKRSLLGEFNSERIISDLERAFSESGQVNKLNNYVALKLSQQGMPWGW